MTVRTKRLACALTQAIAAAALVACGGSNDPSTAADEGAQTGESVSMQIERVRADTRAPTVSITSVGAVDANGAVTLGGSAADNVRMNSVSWTNSLGGSGTATMSGSPTSVTWTAAAIPLQVGVNTITVKARDSYGNTATATQAVTRQAPTTTTPTPTATSWTKVADEGQSFTLPSLQTVRYGANTSWVTKSVSGSAPCTNTYFGSDPAYMVVKSCQVAATTTAPAPTPAPAPAPTVTLSSAAASVTSGSSTTLTWSSSNATSCTAGDAWSGAKATSGSASTGAITASTTYSLTCTGDGGTATQSVTVGLVAPVAVTPSSTITALDFPSNGTTSADIRFRFTGSNLLPMYPATYVWRVKVRKQLGYYTTFFWGPDGAFTGKDFYGAHPYPDGGGSSTSTHKWEISIWGSDYVNDANGNSTQLGYDVWRTQALRVWDNGSAKVHEFYWDLPDTSKVIRVSVDRIYGSTAASNSALTFGDAPWNLGGERLSGLLRGIQLYSSALSVNDILAEVTTPLSSTAGASSIWYLNMNPTPSDITDKSGKGHHPSWVSSSRAGLWTGP